MSKLKNIHPGEVLKEEFLNFGTSAKFWLGLQDDYDLEEEGINKKSELDEIPKINTNAA